MIVFYSWQSDLPNATNRGLIQSALEAAAKQIAADDSIEVEPVIDRDTLGKPGSPSIDQAIFDKIAAADAYVADVSIVNRQLLDFASARPDETKGIPQRAAPNPNVLLELGFAARALGWERIILVFNDSTGDPRIDLPFDLRQKRRLEFTSRPEDADRATPRKKLTGTLDDAIRLIAKENPKRPFESPTETPASLAITAVEDQAPARTARVREFWAWVMRELRKIEPDLRSTPPEGENVLVHIEALKESVARSGSVSKTWSHVCEAIALSRDAHSADAITRGFEQILVEYDHKEGFSGTSYRTWFDFWKFIGHEFFTVWIGCLLKEECWELIDAALNRTFSWEQHRARTNQGQVHFDEFSVYVELFGAESKRNQRLSYHADVLAHRYGPEGIGSTLTFKEFIDADLFLFIAGDLRLEQGWSGWLQWRPWSVLYMKHEPRFLLDSASKKYAAGLKLALGESDSVKIRSMIKEYVPKLRELWRDGSWHCPLTSGVIDGFDTKG